MRALAIPTSVRVELTADVYRTHGARVRDELRKRFELVYSNPARRVRVARADAFDVEIGIDSLQSMDFDADVKYWQETVAGALNAAGLDADSGDPVPAMNTPEMVLSTLHGHDGWVWKRP